MKAILALSFLVSSISFAGSSGSCPVQWGGSGTKVLQPSICFPDGSCLNSGTVSAKVSKSGDTMIGSLVIDANVNSDDFVGLKLVSSGGGGSNQLEVWVVDTLSFAIDQLGHPIFFGNELTQIADPTQAQSSATKHYVDTSAGYTAANPGDWATSAPSTLKAAIDRLARKASGNGGTPIP